MTLTNEQIELKNCIQYLEEKISGLETELIGYKSRCTHVFVNRGESCFCDICGSHEGWWCPKSKDGRCEYDYETNGEECIYCGQPEERK